MKKLYTILILLIVTITVNAQLTTTNTMTPTQLVNNILLGSGVTASNIVFTGNVNQHAVFNATPSSSLGIASGILLSTGNVSTSSPVGPQGPNNSGSTTTDWNGSGDALLNAVSGVTTFDAAILEFDFVPLGDSVKFRYCFGSEEYPEFVNAGVNDAFAFFLSGPNPSGGTYVNKNIALIPATTTPVSIDNVNAISNNIYYRANTPLPGIDCEFDGFTKVLYALEKVACGQVYHIKIAIADGGDGAYDSGVFLEGGSFSSAPPISVAALNSNANFSSSVIVEDCNTNCVYFIRSGNITQKDSFNLQVTGNALLGTDYIQQTNSSFSWPTKLIFNVNQDTLKFCNLKALEDNIVEGTDTIMFTLSSYTNTAAVCVITGSISFNLLIKDYVAISISQNDSILCNGLGVLLNANASFGYPAYTYTWLPSNAHTPTFNTGPLTQPVNYTIIVNDICNKPVSKQITITPSTVPVISAIGPYKFCLDSVQKVPVVISGGKPSISISIISPPNGIYPYNTIGNTYYFLQNANPSSGTYTIIATDQCNIKDTITFNMTTIDCKISIPNVVTPNGDNVNEYFKISGLENFSGTSLLVYNRWGNKIYSNDDYKNDWKPAVNTGTYFYVVNLTDGRKFNGFFEVFKN